MIRKSFKTWLSAAAALFKKKNKYQYADDSIFFGKTYGRQASSPGSHVHLGSSFTKKGFIFFTLILGVIFLIFFSRLFYLQIIKGGDFFVLARENMEKHVPIMAERGQILDRFGAQLTDNIPNFALSLRPNELPKDEAELNKLLEKLSGLTLKNTEEIKEIIKQYATYAYDSIVLSDNLDYEEAISVQIKASDLPGIYIQRSSKRLYNLSGSISLAHIIGYLGRLNREELKNLYEVGYLPSDNIGRAGVEAVYEKYLRGEYGEVVYEVNALGREQAVLTEIEPTAGYHLKLTIDIEMQKKLESILARQMNFIGKTRGAAIAINPQNGEILALVSLPAYNNNDFSGGISREKYDDYIENKDNPLFNRAISGSYPSGSTIKPALAAAALEENIINPNTAILSTGGISVPPWFFSDWLPGGHGRVNVRSSLAWSVNTFYYYIGGGYKNFVGLGIDKIIDYLKMFGFSKYLKIDLPAENAGFLPGKVWKEEVKKENWYIGDTYNVSIGQGDVLVTPLQIAYMTAVVANGGTLYKPRIVQAIVNPKTLAEQKLEIEILNKDFINPDNLETVRLGMKDCVDYGSCRRLAGLPVESAGKTGTAQWSGNYSPHAWYTSFAPFYEPKIVLTVLIEEGESGSAAALPVAEEFYKWWANAR